MRVLYFVVAAFIVSVIAEDYYELLGVDRDADDRTIRKAFKKLAIKKHPDRNKDDPNAHAEFVKINKAYEVLKDENLRKKYDQYGEKGLEDGFNGGDNYQSWQFYNDNFGIYDDDQEIVTLNRADFQRYVTDSNDIWFINFYSTYCSHCHQLAPTWRKFAREIEGTIRVGAVNCAEDPMLCQSQRVGAYPSLVFYPTGEFYNGVRDVELLTEFVIQRLRSEVLHLNSENIKALSEDWEPYNRLPWVVDLCGESRECLSSTTRRKISAMLDGLANVATIDCNEEENICSKFEHSVGVLYFPAGSINPEKQMNIESMDAQEISKKVIELLEELPEIDDDGLKTLLDSSELDEAIAVWFLSSLSQANERKDFRRLPALVTQQIFQIDCSKSNLCDDIVDKAKLPQFAVFKTTGGYEIDYAGSKDFYAAATFIRESAASTLYALNRETYKYAVSGGEMFIVDYFAPWCPPCLKLLGEYRRFHSQMPEDSPLSTVAIASIDCVKYRDLCTAANVQSYPTSILYTPDGKTHRMVGYHSVDSIRDFIDIAMHPSVVEMSPDEFEELVMNRQETETWVVDYFAPWCGPCQQLAPELQKAARAILEYDEKAKTASIDCQKYAQFCKEKGIGSYPTVRIFPAKKTKQPRRSDYYDYPSHMWRNSESIQRWVYNFLPTEVASLGNDFWTTVLDSSEPWIVDFFAPWCGHCIQFAPIYDQIAKELSGKVNFAKIDCDQWPGVCQGAQIRAYPTVRLYTGKTGWTRQEIWGIQIQTQDKKTFIDIVKQQLNIKEHDEL
ncbi:unnamed protein product [Caenorhabditis bovis]|uniref:DnaJ homolog subfamily C member 10 n=1 Tax=Caenorhabditis bovis TaxID=2654633 RepID=A0A8S1EW87_9PELO|nr:unnamed protein product [Caenorhabditis bovis]